MDDLIAFVKARIGEEDARANTMRHEGGEVWLACPATRTEPLGDLEWGEGACDCGLAVRKARALREVAAKQAILADCIRTLDYEDYGRVLAEQVLADLATAWRDHSDFRAGWKS
jgi:hypothetical protein